MPTIPQDIVMYILIAFAVIFLVLVIWVMRLEKKLSILSRGRKGENIEQVFKSFEEEMQSFSAFQGNMEQYLKGVEKRLRKSIQGLGHVHFNAFQGLDSGGRNSFATALLNEHGDGIVLSTIHSRDRVNVFAKEIKQFKALVSLTTEESEALTQAQESCKV